MTTTLIGRMMGRRVMIDGHFLTQWTTHDFTIKARRYVGPVDENGLPTPDAPSAISLLEQRYPWRLPREDGLFLELVRQDGSGS